MKWLKKLLVLAAFALCAAGAVMWLPGRAEAGIPENLTKLVNLPVTTGISDIGRGAAGIVACEGKLYIAGGQSPHPSSPEVYWYGPGTRAFVSYDPKTGTWRQLSPIPTSPYPGAAGRFGFGMTELGGKIYVWGGSQYYWPNNATSWSTVQLNDFWEYNPASDTWSQLPSGPPTAYQHCAALTSCNGKIYLIMNAYNTILWEYNPATRTWTNKGSVPCSLSVMRIYATSLKGLIYVHIAPFSGDPNNCNVRLYRYDPGNSSWSECTSCGLSTSYGHDDDVPLCPVGNRIYCPGLPGEYDSQSNSWLSASRTVSPDPNSFYCRDLAATTIDRAALVKDGHGCLWIRYITPLAPEASVSAAPGPWSTCGRGQVTISIPGMPLDVTGYKIWVYDGYAYRPFDIGNTTIWDSAKARIYPTEEQIASYANDSQTADLFRHDGSGCDLRDDPNGLYLKTEGLDANSLHKYRFKVTAYNPAGESDFSPVYEVEIPNRTDTMPPDGTVSINGGLPKTGSVDAEISLNAQDPPVSNYSARTDDDASGLAYCLVSNDGTNWSNPVQLSSGTARIPWRLEAGPGTKKVYVKVFDNAGNFRVLTATIYLVDDVTPPAVNLLINGGSPTTESPTVDLTINAVDDYTPVSALKFRLSNDARSWTEFAPLTLRYTGWDITASAYGGAPGDGEKQVYIQMLDGAGNIGSQVATIALSTQASAPGGTPGSTEGSAGTLPNTTVEILPSAQARLVVSNPVNVAVVQYSFDGINWSPWEEPALDTSGNIVKDVTFPGMDGRKGLYFRFKNRYGTVSGTYLKQFVLDTTPPQVRLQTLGGAKATTSGSIALKVWVADNVSTSGFTYSVNGGPFAALPEDRRITVSGLDPGQRGKLHTIEIQIKDQAGHIGSDSIDVWSLPR